MEQLLGLNGVSKPPDVASRGKLLGTGETSPLQRGGVSNGTIPLCTVPGEVLQALGQGGLIGVDP